MCGIWFLLSKKSLGSCQTYFENFMKIKHRGPDNTDFKIINEYNAIIGFHRLSINGITKSSANQPFIIDLPDKILYLICNGEIYNHIELSEKYDIELTSGSDCEILLPLYLKIGIDDMLKELVGEFSVIIFEMGKDVNKNHKKVIIFRDQCGIRPCSVGWDDDTIIFASEIKGIPFDNVRQFPPRNYLIIDDNTNFGLDYQPDYKEYIKFEHSNIIANRDLALFTIQKALIDSVRSMMMSEKEIGCLLSGGLDSSLIASIATRIYKEEYGKIMRTFCVAIDSNAPDAIASAAVAAHIGSTHTLVIIPEESWIEAVPHVIYTIESYDITTVRASTGQYLISKWISENTDIKVLLIGDGSDELTGGYLYMHNAPNEKEYGDEILELLNNIHLYDVKRSDRCIAAFGLEPRVPFLGKFLNTYLNINISLRIPNPKEIEKKLLRDSFKNTNYLPMEYLYRKKEAFSDGISTVTKSWFKILQEHINNIITDNEYKTSNYDHCPPPSKEALYYRKYFESYFGKGAAKVIQKFWLPKWSGNITEPSARVLKVYNE